MQIKILSPIHNIYCINKVIMGIGISFLVESYYLHTKHCTFCAVDNITPKISHDTKYHVCPLCGKVGNHPQSKCDTK